MSRIRVGVIGCGAWGRNIVREAAASAGAEVRVVIDPDPRAREAARALAPNARIEADIDAALGASIDALIIASPPDCHAAHARAALDAGLHFLVEKPLCVDAASADDLVRRARRRPGIVALVGHIMRYHPAVERLAELSATGALGPLRFAASARLSERRAEEREPKSAQRTNGLFAQGSALWELLPHDLSIWRAIGRAPLAFARIREPAEGEALAIPFEQACISATLENGLPLEARVSRSHHRKERIFAVAGERATALLDDVREPFGLRLLPSRAETPAELLDSLVREPRAASETASATGKRVEVAAVPPLRRELDHFFSCVRGQEDPRTTLAEGWEVVRVLEQALERYARAWRERVEGRPRIRTSTMA